MGEPEPCSCEKDTPPNSPGPVEAQEVLIRFVEVKEHIGTDGGGRAFLVPAAIRKDDLKGRNGRSLSLAREAHTDQTELQRRALVRTAEGEWKKKSSLRSNAN